MPAAPPPRRTGSPPSLSTPSAADRSSGSPWRPLPRAKSRIFDANAWERDDQPTRIRYHPRQLSNIHAVAKRAGVSIATVSRVLSRPDVVAPGTRLKVLKAVEHLGYAPNSAAKNLRTR